MVTRRELLKVGAAGVMAGVAGCSSEPPETSYEFFVGSYARVHNSIRRPAAKLVGYVEGEVPGGVEALGEFTTIFAEWVISHHVHEDAIYFPGFRKAGRLKSTDASGFDTWVGQHVEFHKRAEALVALGPKIAGGSKEARIEMGKQVTGLMDPLEPHLQAEEQTCAIDRLPEMVTPKQLGAMDAERAAMDQKGDPRLALFFIHSLDPKERTTQFGAEPWIFRSVLVPHVWAGKFERVRPLMPFPETGIVPA